MKGERKFWESLLRTGDLTGQHDESEEEIPAERAEDLISLAIETIQYVPDTIVRLLAWMSLAELDRRGLDDEWVPPWADDDDDDDTDEDEETGEDDEDPMGSFKV